MRLRISHRTTYDYDQPVPYALQQVRLTPRDCAGQHVLQWQTRIEGGTKELSFDDQHGNRVDLVSLSAGTRAVTVIAEGEVETRDVAGVTGAQSGFLPLWMFLRPTVLTRAGTGVKRLMASLPPGDPLARMHALMAAIANVVAYESGASHVGWTAEDTLAAGHGVCQDMAHVMVTCARAGGLPARYVSGYLALDQAQSQAQGQGQGQGQSQAQHQTGTGATHAWAEVHLADLGWVGFDPSNAICPDTRYVRIATGLDYAEAAPVSGTRFGIAGERLSVAVEVAQVQQ